MFKILAVGWLQFQGQFWEREFAKWNPGIPEQNIRAISCLYSWPGQPTPSAPANPQQIHMEYLSEADLRQVWEPCSHTGHSEESNAGQLLSEVLHTFRVEKGLQFGNIMKHPWHPSHLQMLEDNETTICFWLIYAGFVRFCYQFICSATCLEVILHATSPALLSLDQHAKVENQQGLAFAVEPLRTCCFQKQQMNQQRSDWYPEESVYCLPTATAGRLLWHPQLRCGRMRHVRASRNEDILELHYHV